MRLRLWSLTIVFIMGLVAAVAPQEKGGQEEFGPYEPVPNWPQPLPDGPDGVKHVVLRLCDRSASARGTRLAPRSIQ